jgi:cbb3-type cytochrome oxidase subunit 3
MPRDTVVSWRTFALFLLFPPLAVVALVLFPVTLLVVFWLYHRGRRRAMNEASVP